MNKPKLNIFLILYILFAGGNLIAQQDCNDIRYVQELFSVQLTSEPAIYATAPAIASPYLLESFTFMQDLSFDFYEPMGDNLSERPLIIMAFGGAFLVGSKNQVELVAYCEEMARRGFCVASIDYRLGFNAFSTASSTRAVYRGLQDFKAAVRFFRHNASDYNIDPDQIFAGGNSAGSINAIHSAYVDESDRVPGSLFDATFSSPDLGCINCSGNTLSENSDPSVVINLWGGIGQIDWIESEEAKINSFHGLDDTTVSPYSNFPFNYPVFPILHGSVPIQMQAESVGILNQLDTFPGEGHELWTDPNLADLIVLESANFLNDHLKPILPAFTGPQTVCANEIVTYCVDNPDPTYDYCWNANYANLISENGNCITVSWLAQGQGQIDLKAINAYEAHSEINAQQINIQTTPIAEFSFQTNGTQVNFTDESIGALIYDWDFGDGTESMQASPTHNFQTDQGYFVSLNTSNMEGCSDMHTEFISINCLANLDLIQNPIPTGTYKVLDYIHTNQVIVQDSEVDFRAESEILMLAGFDSGTNSSFQAIVETCNN